MFLESVWEGGQWGGAWCGGGMGVGWGAEEP